MKGIKCSICGTHITYSYHYDTNRKKDVLLYLRQTPCDKWVGAARGALGYCLEHLPKLKSPFVKR